MGKSTHRVTPGGTYVISPGLAAGAASVRRYFGILAYTLKALALGAVMLTIAAACIAAARGIMGLDLMPLRLATRLSTIDRTETAAMLLGLGIALTTGVPMGMYIHGFLSGYSESPWGED